MFPISQNCSQMIQVCFTSIECLMETLNVELKKLYTWFIPNNCYKPPLSNT